MSNRNKAVQELEQDGTENLTATPEQFSSEPEDNGPDLDSMSRAELTEELDKMRRMIREIADKGQLQRYDENNRANEPMQKKVSLSVYNGKAIVSWTKLLVNMVTKIQGVPHTFVHTTEVTYSDGSKEKLDYVTLHRDKEMKPALVLEELENKKTGVVTFTVKTDDYGTFEINSNFVN